ncbi:glycoside hydrolase family 15 protein [Reinekea blandensis]|uniref:Phosphorylase kinase alphabeta n=1 Tax=Reinekea blandensis MED297 TaxID=314283 RepID=A4BGM9_9GAMM|nr:glycoside hydrolase family 15 protein [Reinekea blandensis]EAR08677.1 Phosphorylase kinase alphabeta [Reinekea sp. MED297] [Reinekea blandensis MED297]
MSRSEIETLTTELDQWYELTEQTILCRQDPVSGLFPASTDVNGHGDYTDAWVRDNVYSIMAVWGLWVGYQKFDHFPSRTQRLADSVHRLMRGLLTAMMRQTHKVERFKYTQNPLDALHAKYDTQSGEVVVDDDKWGHLQLDATSLFLLMLAQMSRSGLSIVSQPDEVSFVQNLVWYIGRGYRTPDYGIWERGNKINNGRVEINASSVGMVKAALQAMQGLNLLPDSEGQIGTIHVMDDEIARCRSTLESLLPRESLSKEVDAACLSIIGFPAFAVEKTEVIEQTRARVLDKLAGPYGCARFLRDGHQTVLEDHDRLHYESHELQNFENIESQWPLFYAFLYLDALFRVDQDEIRHYRALLDGLRVEKDGLMLLPELYFVDAEHIEAEKAAPGSQPRRANNNVPLVWTQSLYTLGCLLDAGVLSPSDIDPINSFARIGKQPVTNIGLTILAEDADVQRALAEQGVESCLSRDIEPIRVFDATELSRVFHAVGQNPKLGLTGRPQRNPRVLATSQLYRLSGETVVFLPQFSNRDRFYLASDNALLCELLQSELAYISRHWQSPKDPVMVLDITHAMLSADDSVRLTQLLSDIQNNRLSGLQSRSVHVLEQLNELAMEQIDDLRDYQLPPHGLVIGGRRRKWLAFDEQVTVSSAESVLSLLQPDWTTEQLVATLAQSANPYQQVDCLARLKERYGLDFETGLAPLVSVRLLSTELYETATEHQLWSVMRHCAGLLDKHWSGLEDSVAEILTRQRIIVVGRAFSDQGMITTPLQNREILQLIRQNTARDPREGILNQEILIMIASLMRGEPELLSGMKSIRPGHLAMLMMGQLAHERSVEPDVAFAELTALCPSDIESRVRRILSDYQSEVDRLFNTESLHAQQSLVTLDASTQESSTLNGAHNWLQWREQQGVMPRLQDDFYEQLWRLLKQCRGVVVGDRFDSRSRIESDHILSAMTAGEPQFALLIERLLNKIESPSYRQMTIEALRAIMALAQANPQLRVDDYLIVEVIISHAVRLNWIENFPARASHYNQFRGQAWQAFYQNPPQRVASRIGEALNYLLQQGRQEQLSDGGLGEPVH